jgi:hypothetical protein
LIASVIKAPHSRFEDTIYIKKTPDEVGGGGIAEQLLCVNGRTGANGGQRTV